ncbi:NIF-domain-containing protein [Epithele typhae]|uniref:NIF-domain-containing protein n=1 Tax=Epithele typhae TaxID=378194 RepID=UPI0020088976|nr:NIF-domain-containing protein [Epithele typhae]KAH9912607.1 NIF-domain-containing protein [Epithele typhae]
MNSLSYLSRQFDVLASPRTPPGTPTNEDAPFALKTDPHARLKRSGSTKSFLAPQPSSSSHTWLKRSYSSPAQVNPTASLLAPVSRRPSVSAASTEKAIRLKGGRDASPALRHIFFVRIVLQLWHALLAAIRSLPGRSLPPIPVVVDEVAVDDASDDEDKDTEEDEGSKHEKGPPAPVSLDSSPHSPYQPANRSPLSQDPRKAPPTPPPLVKALEAGAELEKERRITPTPPLDLKALLAPSITPPGARSRADTPTPPPKQSPFHRQKTLVLDLDETLIHSTSRPMPYVGGSGLFGFGGRNKGAGYTVEVVLGGRSTLYHVYKRPFVDYFLRKVSQWYTLVIFTASMQEYADPVIDWLDAGRGILGRRLFRESCTQLPNGSYTKDLSIIEQDLSCVCLVDNSPVCYTINEANGIPIEGWTHDPHDEALLDLLPVLDSLRFTSDVRRVLGIRGFS